MDSREDGCGVVGGMLLPLPSLARDGLVFHRQARVQCRGQAGVQPRVIGRLQPRVKGRL